MNTHCDIRQAYNSELMSGFGFMANLSQTRKDNVVGFQFMDEFNWQMSFQSNLFHS